MVMVIVMDEEASRMVSNGLTIKTAANSDLVISNPDLVSSPSPYSSPLVSPPSSAFVSALQSPYISPRLQTPKPQLQDSPESIVLTPITHSEDTDQQSRISFSFPIPRVSFAKGSASPASNARLRSCDVFIGFHGHCPNLVRFCKWLKSDLELQGIACFVADRAKYADSQSHEIADRVICSVTYGVVVVTSSGFLNYLTMEEIRFFAQKKNLIPVFFDTGPAEIIGLLNCNSVDKERKEAIEGLMKFHEFKLEADEGSWRSCVSRAAGILRGKLGRKSVVGKDMEGFEELPFPRNRSFVGRDKEMMEIEAAFFGDSSPVPMPMPMPTIRGGGGGEASGSGQSADEESDTFTARGRYISLEMGKCKEATMVEPVLGRKRPNKHKKPKSVVCINGVAGIGKTDIALEFAYRFSQRYKMVLWVGGEARYLRQNILNLSLNLGLDVSADAEKERGRIRSFEEQEFEAFKRVKRELFRDMPYLLIIDNLETDKEWWEGKDLHDLIPRNTGGTHVIITTRLSKVMSFDTIQLPPLPLSDAMILIRGTRKKDYPADELEVLRKFDEKLARSSFGLMVIGSLLSELAISPSALFEAINQVPLDQHTADEQNNPFLVKVLNFCYAVLQQTSGSGSRNRNRNLLASRMLLVGAWFASAPISVSLLASAANNLPASGSQLRKWSRYVSYTFGCGFATESWNKEEESALALVRLGLARRANRQVPGCWIQFHPITQAYAKRKQGVMGAKATVEGVRRMGNPIVNAEHLWATAFLVFGFKCEPPVVQLKAMDMVLYIKKTAVPLAIRAFTSFSRCSSALELLKVCTNVLEEVEKSFVTQIQDWCEGSLCWKKRQRVDEYVWQDVTLLKATLLETRAKLLLRGGHFDSAEDLCRTCISIRTVMLGHNHAQTLAAQETLSKLVRMRTKI